MLLVEGQRQQFPFSSTELKPSNGEKLEKFQKVDERIEQRIKKALTRVLKAMTAEKKVLGRNAMRSQTREEKKRRRALMRLR